MSIGVGIGLAFVAMLSWGFGDFLIQRSARRIGDFETMFAITGFGAVILLPFVFERLPAVFAGPPRSLMVLVGGGVALLVAGFLELESVRRGKLAVIEPTWSLEIPAAVLLAFLVLGERLSFFQLFLMGILIVGLFLVSFRGALFTRSLFLERGVFLSIIAALLMGATNFLLGFGARLADPLVANFFASSILALVSGVYLLASGRMFRTFHHLAMNRALLLPMVVADNAAWIAFAFSMTIAPIGIATALSESYIVIAVILGLSVNRERLELHQKVGLVAAIVAAISIAAITA